MAHGCEQPKDGDMSSTRAGIAVGCSSCSVDRFFDAADEDELRTALAAFFDAHDGCDVHMDVSRTVAPLPRRATS